MQVLLQLLPADAAGNTAVSATEPPRALLEAVAQDDAEDSEGAGGHGKEWKKWKRMEEKRISKLGDAYLVLAFSSGSGLAQMALPSLENHRKSRRF